MCSLLKDFGPVSYCTMTQWCLSAISPWFSLISVYSIQHKVRIYKEYHSVCPLVGSGTLPPLLSPASVPLPPRTGGRGTLACGWGVGAVPIPTTGEKAWHSAYSVVRVTAQYDSYLCIRCRLYLCFTWRWDCNMICILLWKSKGSTQQFLRTGAAFVKEKV